MSKESNCCLDTEHVKAIMEEIKNKTKRKAIVSSIMRQ